MILKENIIENAIFLVIFLIGLSSSILFYSANKKSLVERTIDDYENTYEISKENLVNNLDKKKQLLAVIERYFKASDLVSEDEFFTFTQGMIEDNNLDDICLIKPEKNYYYSLRKNKEVIEYHVCSEFDLLSRVSLLDEENPKIFLSQYISSEKEDGIYVGIVFKFDELITAKDNPFDEYFLLISKDDNKVYNYSTDDKKLSSENSLSIESSFSHNYFHVLSFGNADFFYLTMLDELQLSEDVYNSILIISFFIFSLIFIFALYVRKISIQKNEVKHLVTKKTLELSESRSFLELIMSHIPDLIFVKNKEFEIINANNSFFNLYPENKKSDVIGSTAYDVFDKQEADKFQEKDMEAFEYGTSEITSKVFLPNGEARILHTKKVKFQDKGGESYILGLSHDVTEREILLNDLTKTNEELSQFSYRTSHDLKSPLTTIKGLAKFIDEDIRDGEIDEALININKIFTQAQKLEDLVTDILDLAKADLADDENITDINVFKMIESIKEKHGLIIEEADIEVNYQGDKAYRIYAEKARINQILENLITNSIKYSDANKNNKFVNIDLQFTENTYILTIQDNGVGIPKEHQADLFKMFKRFHANLASGSGMGLSIVKRHIDKLGGEIEVSSSEDGTKMVITIPIKEEIKHADRFNSDCR